MQNARSIAPSIRPIPIALILMAALVVNLPLLLMKLPLKSFDSNLHIFFASHYVHHWFDPWNAKWYAGFSQTTYPPLPQQWVALASRILGMDMAYMAVPASRIHRSPGECVSRLGELPCLFRRSVGHNIRGAHLSECTSIPVRMGQAWQLAFLFEG